MNIGFYLKGPPAYFIPVDNNLRLLTFLTYSIILLLNILESLGLSVVSTFSNDYLWADYLQYLLK